MIFILGKVEKELWEKEKMLITSIFSPPPTPCPPPPPTHTHTHNGFIKVLPQGCSESGLYGKEKKITPDFFHTIDLFWLRYHNPEDGPFF